MYLFNNHHSYMVQKKEMECRNFKILGKLQKNFKIYQHRLNCRYSHSGKVRVAT